MSKINKLAVQTAGLAKSYNGFWALKGIDFSVQKGEIFGFLGPNGAGKTTTLRIITGLSRSNRGDVFIFGHNIQKDEIWVKQHIGAVPEVSNLYPELSSLNNLIFIAQLYGIAKKSRRERAEDLLREFGLYDKRNVLFSQLSKGMKRSLTIAASLVHKPEIVFLDEPTIGLDVASSRHLRALIQQLHRSGVTIFLTTHNIGEAEALCQRVAILVKGEIISMDTVEALKRMTPAPQRLIFTVDGIKQGLKQQLSRMERVKSLELTNSSIEVQCDDVDLVLEAVLKILRKEKVRIRAINTASASLEDTFVHLTGLDLELMKIDKELKP